MMTLLRFFLFAALLALAHAGTRPEDAKWLEAKAAEPGVVATGTGLLYKGQCHFVSVAVRVCLCYYRYRYRMPMPRALIVWR